MRVSGRPGPELRLQTRGLSVQVFEPREIILDPIKPVNIYAFRPTVRIWNISDPLHPTETSVADMPTTWRDPANPAHTNIGIMEGAKTHAAPNATTCGTGIAPANCKPGDAAKDYDGSFLWSKGFFSESMCGGGVFWDPDVTAPTPDNSGVSTPAPPHALCLEHVEYPRGLYRQIA